MGSSLLFLLGVRCTKTTPNKTVVAVNQLLEQAEKLDRSDKNKVAKLNQAIQLVLQQPNDSVSRNLLLKVTKKYYYAFEDPLYYKYSKKCRDLALQANDSTHLAKAYTYQGEYFYTQNKADSAVISYKKAQKIYSLLKDNDNTARVIIRMAEGLIDAGSHDLAEIETIKALELIKNTKDVELLCDCNNTIGLCEIGLVDYDNALKYYNNAYKNIIALEKNPTKQVEVKKLKIIFYNNLGYTYVLQKKFPEAYDAFKKGLELTDTKKGNLKNKSLLLYNYANAKVQNKDTVGVKKMLSEALHFSESSNSSVEYARSTITLGEYYLLKKDTVSGLRYLREGLALSKKNNSSDDVREVLKILTKSDAQNRKFYVEEYIKVDDSIKKEEQKTRTKFARIAFETNELEEENKTLTLQTLYGYGVIVLLLGLIFVGYYLFRLRIRNRELRAKESLEALNKQIYDLIIERQFVEEEAQTKERERIGMELHDGVVNDLFTLRYNFKRLPTGQVENQLEKSEHAIRLLSHKLGKEDAYGTNYLEEVLSTLVNAQTNDTQTQFSLYIDDDIDWTRFGSDDKINMYRIVQEALQNVNKYSKAKNCSVDFQLKNGFLCLKIKDDGVGFDAAKNKTGMGLDNFRKRASKLKAQYELTTAPGMGTTLEFFIGYE